MKIKITTLVLSLCIILSLFLISCNKKDGAQSSSESITPESTGQTSDENSESSTVTAKPEKNNQNADKNTSSQPNKGSQSVQSDKNNSSEDTVSDKKEPSSNVTSSVTSNGSGAGSRPQGTSSDKTETEKEFKEISYKEYLALSDKDRQEYCESFGDYRKFADWYYAAKAEYDNGDDKIHISGDGEIDLDDYLN